VGDAHRRWTTRVPAVLGSLAVVGFVAIEGRLRQGAEARSFQAGDDDEGTTREVGAAFPVALFAPPLAAVLPGPRLPVALGYLGGLAACGGAGLHVLANRALGPSYTRTLRVREGQSLIDTGLYARVRHPGYTGALAMWAGYAVAWRALPGLLALVPLVRAYSRRIAVEERMLVANLGIPYERYRERTWRLLPGVY
jgi:protein-S-isoprenylcysteine O-methyltransferase Ste14